MRKVLKTRIWNQNSMEDQICKVADNDLNSLFRGGWCSVVIRIRDGANEVVVGI